MDNSFVQSVWTVLAMIVFIGIVIWAYSSKRKADFDQAGRMAVDDDKPVKNSKVSAAGNNGSSIEE